MEENRREVRRNSSRSRREPSYRREEASVRRTNRGEQQRRRNSSAARRAAIREKRRRKVLMQKLLLFFLILIISLAVIFLGRRRDAEVSGRTLKEEVGKETINDYVESYRELVEQIASEYGMVEYADLILAVIMQESSGLGTDIMSSSESGFNTQYSSEPGSIEDPSYSIHCGLMTLQISMERAKVRGPKDIDRIAIALQGYNFGINGYLDYVKEHHITKWSRESAEDFAKMASGEVLRAETDPYAEAAGPWDYGDQRYPEHVLRYYSYQN